MSENSQLNADLSDFPGSAALFPLPGGVFFPQIVFPLHIFETRYRQMTADVLAGDRFIAMALLQPGWERLSEDRVPPIYETVCLSRITAEEKLSDGRYYLVFQGLSRARILQETPTDRPYRIGKLALLNDQAADFTKAEEQRVREELFRGIESWHPDLAVKPMFAKALDGEFPLGEFCDLIGYALPLPPRWRQEILAELDVVRRSRLVLDAIHSDAVPDHSAPLHYPPEFSRN